ncbi:hypothetical protein BG46_01340 [Brucella anthropi]|uniref:hypothetical protein n=1 Tax=Brucella anthropi TaxID=529 RepID=UPI0004471450|nr:hypothetical protein [Brucella anthropi]EXL08571.1 hypothetical protein BG46_01340 [Brucella anthropi]
MSPYLMIDGGDAVLKSYKSSTVGTKSVLRLELEISDHIQLGYLLREFANFQSEQRTQRKTATKVRREPVLQLPYYGKEE